MALRCISAVERTLVDGLFIRVDTQFDHAKWYCATHEYITATVWYQLEVSLMHISGHLACVARYCAFSPDEWIHELRIIDVLCYCAWRKYQQRQ